MGLVSDQHDIQHIRSRNGVQVCVIKQKASFDLRPINGAGLALSECLFDHNTMEASLG